jgi:oligo-1,6-glucosidase
VPRPSGIRQLKQSLARWQDAMGQRGWNSLYLENHDQPRSVSRFGDDTTWWRESATALATVLHLHRGTPYVYQGQELGVRNAGFTALEDYRDIESLNHHAAATAAGADPDTLLAVMATRSRDNARTPVPWTAGLHAGFTTGEPWIPVNADHTWLNAEAQRDDDTSVLAHHRRLVALRHDDPLVVHGDFTLLHPDHPALWAFARTGADGRLTVWANCSGEPLPVDLGAELAGEDAAELVLANHADADPRGGVLRPWEVWVLRTPR